MTKTLQIVGMMCAHCVAHVQNALQALPGVTAKVSLDRGEALVTCAQPVSDGTLIQAVEDAGYQVKSIS